MRYLTPDQYTREELARLVADLEQPDAFERLVAELDELAVPEFSPLYRLPADGSTDDYPGDSLVA